MKPLLSPAIAFGVVSLILASLVRELLAAPLPFDDQPLHLRLLEKDLHEPQLPTSSHGDHDQPAEVTAVLEHRSLSSCRSDCRIFDHWLVQLRVTDAPWIDARPMPLLDENLAAGLTKVSARSPENLTDPLKCEATLAIFAPAAAPLGVVRLLVRVAQGAGIHRVEVAVAAADRRAKGQRLKTHIPLFSWGAWRFEDVGIRICLSRNAATGRCERTLAEQWNVWASEAAPAAATPRRTWPCDESGDASFSSFVEQWVAGQRQPEVGAAVDAKNEVPLQAVVDLIGSLRNAGLERVAVFFP